jgi:hypothetical protein
VSPNFHYYHLSHPFNCLNGESALGIIFANVALKGT